MLTFKTKLFTLTDCDFDFHRYKTTNNIYIGIISESEGLVCHCTVNTHEKLSDDRIAVSNYGPNIGMEGNLKKLDIIKGKPVDYIPSGMIDIPVYMLSKHGLELIEKNLSKS